MTAPRDEDLPDEFGPAMLALTELQRRFVLEWFAGDCRDAAGAARKAGVSDASEGCKVYASRALRHPKITAAIREVAGREFGALSALAIMGLKRSVRSGKHRERQAAADSILDRSGFGRTSVQDIRVEQVDRRSTAELMAAAKGLLPSPKVIDGEFQEVE